MTALLFALNINYIFLQLTVADLAVYEMIENILSNDPRHLTSYQD